ncbi:DUF2070 family protein [Thermofilum pendens]|uniref:Membrane protein-like protein n=1 Tax=Thermofilum pendens (strain DSM 2475 / Hrk 5) TaxID=368408 RepID=A1RXM0_THEPD|nr:DUF2070 family protein [Thermofilum pendens]ABL77950.1 membrane protein-like protein [Thermofilum pendens Hrk 5]
MIGTHGDHFEGFKSSYKWIIRLPATRVLAPISFSLLLLSLGASLLLGVPPSELLHSLLLGAAVPLYLHVCDRRVFNFRRSLGVFLLYLAMLPLVLVLRKPPILATVLEGLVGFLLAVGILSVWKAGALAILYFLWFSVAHNDPRALYILSAFFLASSTVFFVVDRRIRKAAGVSGVGFLEAFLKYILSGARSEVEEYLERISVERTLQVHVYSFTADREIGRLVISNVHPGPLRDLGSSTLPQLIAKCRDTPTLFLKAPCTHSENLPRLRYSEELAGAVCSCTPSPAVDRCGLGYSSSGKVDVVRLAFGEIPDLVFLDPQVIMEDLPYRVSEESHAVEGAVAVDLHNMIAPGYLKIDEDDEIEIAEIVSAIHEASEEVEAEGEIYAGFARVEYTDGASVGPGGVACAVLQIAGKKLLLLSIDGNNMTPDFKERVLRTFKESFEKVLVATTDTHLYTGLYRNVDYYPVGALSPEKVLETCMSCVEKALKNVSKVRVGYCSVPFRGRFMDGEMLRRISVATKKNTRDSLAVVFLAFAVSLALLLLP